MRRGRVYGDSGLAVRRAVYERVGGFRPIPLFEDLDLSRRLRCAGEIRYLPDAELRISARRWEATGILRQTVLNRCLTLAYLAGVEPARLVRYYRERSLKLTPQRYRIFERAFSTHEHFSAETLYGWLRDEDGPSVSRATVYRTLGLLVEGGFLESLDPGQGELLYEHVLGHRHHDHLVCVDCGRIEEFYDEEIERLQEEAAARKGFELVSHNLRLFGTCASCTRKRQQEPQKSQT